MDPYHTLGVPRGSTRDEVKQAFRVRAWHAHPDRGGDGQTFIRLCTAYKQILEELDRNPKIVTRKPARGTRRAFSSKPPDPDWEPELVVLDEPPRKARPPQPPDPGWEPDLILLDERPRGPGTSRESYLAWLGRVSAQHSRRKSAARPRWDRAIGTMILMGLIAAGIVICWIVWKDAERTAAPQAATSYERME